MEQGAEIISFRAKSVEIFIVFCALFALFCFVTWFEFQTMNERRLAGRDWELHAVGIGIYSLLLIQIGLRPLNRIGTKFVIDETNIQKISRTGKVLENRSIADITKLTVMATLFKSPKYVLASFSNGSTLRIDSDYENLRGFVTTLQAKSGKDFNIVPW